MPLEMYAGAAQAAIGPHEEFLFALLEEDDARFPQLAALWQAFYDSPRLPGAVAGDIVHELIDLLAVNGGSGNKALANLVLRLLPFFSAAYRSGQEVRCCSD